MTGNNQDSWTVSNNVNEKNIALLDRPAMVANGFKDDRSSGNNGQNRSTANQDDRQNHLLDKLEKFTAATRDLLQSVLGLEFQLAALTSLTEHFGSRYNERATVELQASSERVHLVETRRISLMPAILEALGLHDKADLGEIAVCAPEPFASILSDARIDLIRARERIGILKTSAEEVLGRRIALAEEAFRSPGAPAEAIYGKGRAAIPRIVNNIL